MSSWFFGNIDRVQSELFMSSQPDGAYLVRTGSELGTFVLYLRASGCTANARINVGPKNKFYIGSNGPYVEQAHISCTFSLV